MTAPINEGNSGGPVIDENGNLIGIAQGGLIRRDVENVRIASRISTVATALSQALLFRKFSIQVKAKIKRLTSREIFRFFSPYVVRIEVSVLVQRILPSKLVVDSRSRIEGFSFLCEIGRLEQNILEL